MAKHNEMTDRLSNEERGKLMALVKRIKANSESVLTDLAEIHAKRLYREHSSFKEFVQTELGMSKSRAYQLLQECEVRHNLSTIVDTLPPPSGEAQIRPMVGLTPEEQAAVWEDAVAKAKEEGKTIPTAAIVEEIVQLHKQQAEPYVEEEEEQPEEEEVEEPTIEEAMKMANSALESLGRRITSIKDEAESLDNPHVTNSGRLEILGGQLRAAAGTLRAAKCAGLCPYCKGDGCKHCYKTGWATKETIEAAPA